jgi:cytochrome c553
MSRSDRWPSIDCTKSPRDPARGVPPCAACHGPGASKPGAPTLKGQAPAYIERQLGAFAQGMRQNDINEQMCTVASQQKKPDRQGISRNGEGLIRRTRRPLSW